MRSRRGTIPTATLPCRVRGHEKDLTEDILFDWICMAMIGLNLGPIMVITCIFHLITLQAYGDCISTQLPVPVSCMLCSYSGGRLRVRHCPGDFLLSSVAVANGRTTLSCHTTACGARVGLQSPRRMPQRPLGSSPLHPACPGITNSPEANILDPPQIRAFFFPQHNTPLTLSGV